MSKLWILIGSLSAFLSVALGAFAAHGLERILDPQALSVFRTAAQYQMYHSLGLIGLGASRLPGRVAGWSFTVGIFLFSGSLYLLACTGIKSFGMITPLGGLLFMLGWLNFAFRAWKSKS